MIDLLVYDTYLPLSNTQREGDLIIALIDMTNEFISYRNDIWEGVIDHETMEIPDNNDKILIDNMDREIKRVMKLLKYKD